MRTVVIGLLGGGNIGCGVLRLLKDMEKDFAHRYQLQIRVKRVLVRDLNKPRPQELPRALLTDDPDQVIGDDEIKLIVECLGGEEPASALMARALKRGKPVVTANKMAIALNWHALQQAAREGNAGLYFEASVCGAIPVIRTLNDSLQANRLDTVMGIVNGTTNYILSAMSERQLSYRQALEEAQQLGLAEPDPSSDVEGFDAAYKLSVLASLAFHARIPYAQIHREGIGDVALEDIEAGRDLGLRLKLLAVAKRNGSEIDVRVHPAFVPESHPLAAVNGAFNAVFLHGHACGDMMLYGRGAGSAPTAGAILSDLIHALQHERPLHPSFDMGAELSSELHVTDNWRCAYYLRFVAENAPGVLGHIATQLGKEGVSIESLLQRGTPISGEVPVIVMTHEANEKDLRAALQSIDPKKARVVSAIRLEGRAER